VKLLLDEMLDASIAHGLRKRGYDVAAIQRDAALEGKDDPDVLRTATQQNRVLVTNNVEDFARLHQRFLADGEEHAGIILVSSRSLPRSKRTIGLWVQTLVEYLDGNPTTSLKNECRWLP
jgi:predicted nuclease of predicted toxin-antitoxin system